MIKLKQILHENINEGLHKSLKEMGFKFSDLPNYIQYSYRSTLKDCDNSTPKTLRVFKYKSDNEWSIQYGVCDTVFKKELINRILDNEILERAREIKNMFN